METKVDKKGNTLIFSATEGNYSARASINTEEKHVTYKIRDVKGKVRI